MIAQVLVLAAGLMLTALTLIAAAVLIDASHEAQADRGYRWNHNLSAALRATESVDLPCLTATYRREPLRPVQTWHEALDWYQAAGFRPALVNLPPTPVKTAADYLAGVGIHPERKETQP